MNKKGFTLVELLAVIAILAILVIIALPNVMGMFNTAKENSFKTEVKEVFKVAQEKWMMDSMYNTSDHTYSRCKDGCSNGLDLSGRSDLQYCIKVNKAGKVTEYYATDGTFQYSFNNPEGLTIENITDVQKVSGSNVTLTCDGIISDNSVTPEQPELPEPEEPVNENETLYYVLQHEAEENTYAKEYTGAHMDSVSGNGINKIYHFYASNKANAEAILEKNNVILGDTCWQMYRTTDTGGVRMIYNGVAEDNQCLKTRPKNVGFDQSRVLQFNGTYYYSTSVRYDENAGGFYLSGDKFEAKMSDSNGESLEGKYTCKSTNPNDMCTYVYRIDDFRSTYNADATTISKNQANYDTIGVTYFNEGPRGLNIFGYMHNEEFGPLSKGSTSRQMLQYDSLSNGSYYVADSYTYNSSTKKYTLVNPVLVDAATANSMLGKYTFLSTTANTSNTTIRYVFQNKNGYYSYIYLSKNESLDEANYYITYGSNYTENQNGTYTISSPTTIRLSDYPTKYSTLKEKYVCLHNSNGTCEDLIYVGDSYAKVMYTLDVKNYVFANSVTYQNGKYKLSSDRVTLWEYVNQDKMGMLDNHHYTCWTTGDECEEVYYVYGTYLYQFYNTELKYLKLQNGELINSYLNRLLSSNDVNSKDSSIKAKIDLWYQNFMTDYTSYLDDTIYCNNRNISKIAGWNPNGGSIKDTLMFSSNCLDCPNETDRFSVSNQKAKLKYPVGLITKEELDLLGNDTLKKSSSSYWTMTPKSFGREDSIYYTYISYGSITAASGYAMGIGIRPVVTLKKNITYSSGVGSTEAPYIVKLN